MIMICRVYIALHVFTCKRKYIIEAMPEYHYKVFFAHHHHYLTKAPTGTDRRLNGDLDLPHVSGGSLLPARLNGGEVADMPPRRETHSCSRYPDQTLVWRRSDILRPLFGNTTGIRKILVFIGYDPDSEKHSCVQTPDTSVCQSVSTKYAVNLYTKL